MTDVQVFQNDDTSYLRWLSENQRGWVLNVPGSTSGTVVKHQSECGMIRGARAGTWTGKHYYKVAARSPTELAHWLSTNWSGRARSCRHCLEASDVTGPPRTRGTEVVRQQLPSQPSEKVSIGPSVHTGPVSMPWRLWSMGQPVLVLDSISPQRLSWDRAEHINQQRLRAYLAPIRSKMAPIIASGSKWALSMTVDLERENRLFRGNDVDNYIAPVIKALGWERFVYADVTKRVGGGSHIALAPAVHHSGIPSGNGWSRRIFGRIDTEAGKRAIREGLRQQVDAPLPLGPVAVHLAWRLAVMRNWVNFWKPTVDAMGPVVGEPRIHKREFHPDDDRITTLTLHRLVDDSLNNKTVDVGLWWDRR